MLPHPPTSRHPRWGVIAGVSALLVLHVVLAVSAVATKSVTADEILHVTGGYFYNKFGDFRIHPENGVLPQRIEGLWAWLSGAPAPPLAGNPYWRTSDAAVVGYQFFYETGHDHWPMLLGARALLAVFSTATGLLIFLWSRRLFGPGGSWLSLALWALCPNFLAHDGLATSDSFAVFFLLAASGAWWRYLRQPTWSRGLLSALTFGLAAVAKYSAVLLLPIMLLLIAWRVVLEEAGARRRWWWLAPLSLAGHALATGLVIWACYNFRYSAFAPGIPAADHFIVPWDRVLPFIGWQGRVVQFFREWRLLPEAFLYGYAWVIQSAKARSAFLAGDYSIVGWVSFFPWAFWWKTTTAALLALVTGAILLARHWLAATRRIRSDLASIAPLLVLFAVYWAFSLASHLNIGHRHILCTYPVLYILLGGLAAPAVAWLRRWRVILPVLVVAGQAAASVAIYPDYLAFFNRLAGGPTNGWRLLVDSSLDWGQDLPCLARWLREHNSGPAAQPVFLSYFGSGKPRYYGIQATQLPFVNGFKLPHPWYRPEAGLYCVSATMLQQVYSPVHGEWSLAREKEYQELRILDGIFRGYWQDPAARSTLRPTAPDEQWQRAWKRYDLLRFARLCHYLRARRPDAMIGYSILIYRLTEAEVDAAIDRPYSEWLQAIERAHEF
ncbi:MAG: glycosyltransferase family 39 protein [Opitutaceae bacterium]|nr:glycosyltransferase family 39 protein [Opitutaceae bacterium]